METHSGDSPMNRFCSFWGAIFSFLFFGVVILLFIGFGNSLSSGETAESIDDERRTELDSKSIADQQAAVNTWKKNDDGSYEVPASVALPLLAGKMAKPGKSAVPVPGTKAAEEAAQAAAAAAEAEAQAASKSEAEPESSQNP